MDKSLWIKRIGLFFVTTTLTLCFLEFIMRIGGFAPKVFPIDIKSYDSPFIISKNEKLGYVYKKNFIDNITNQKLTNSFGLRDRERVLNKAPNVKRILVLGDSVIDGNLSESMLDKNEGLYSLNDNIPAKLEDKLKKDKIEVLNLGTNGYCTLQEVELLKRKGVLFHPDHVILNFVENDYIHCFGMLESADLEGSKIWLASIFQRSSLFRFFAVRTNALSLKKNIIIDVGNIRKNCYTNELCKYLTDHEIFITKEYRSDPEKFNWKAFNLLNLDNVNEKNRLTMKFNKVATFLEAMKELQMTVDAYHYKLDIVIWPTFYAERIIDLDFDSSEKKVNEDLLIETVAKKLGMNTIRLSPYFREHYQSLRTQVSPNHLYTIGDSMHPNRLGADTAANAMIKLLHL